MIPDPIEQLEAMQENVAHAHAYDDATGTMECAGCGKRLTLNLLWPVSNHPASAFVCEGCLNTHYGPDAPGPYTQENLA